MKKRRRTMSRGKGLQVRARIQSDRSSQLLWYFYPDWRHSQLLKRQINRPNGEKENWRSRQKWKKQLKSLLNKISKLKPRAKSKHKGIPQCRRISHLTTLPTTRRIQYISRSWLSYRVFLRFSQQLPSYRFNHRGITMELRLLTFFGKNRQMNNRAT